MSFCFITHICLKLTENIGCTDNKYVVVLLRRFIAATFPPPTWQWPPFYDSSRSTRACRVREFFAFYRFIIRADLLVFGSRIRRADAAHEVESRGSLRTGKNLFSRFPLLQFLLWENKRYPWRTIILFFHCLSSMAHIFKKICITQKTDLLIYWCRIK